MTKAFNANVRKKSAAYRKALKGQIASMIQELTKLNQARATSQKTLEGIQKSVVDATAKLSALNSSVTVSESAELVALAK
jgi:hypothetical protein